LIMITGHLGGTLTHGAGYLTSAWNNDTKKGVAIPPVPAIQEAVVYTDLIQPLFQNRCYNCHGSGKQKGKLRLDSPDFLLKGGESGNTIIKGEPGESELIERLLLPTDDEDHMPPKEKPQLTQNEIALLHWWISTGNDFTKKVKDLPQTDKIKPVLLALQAGSFSEENKITDVPEAPVKKADDKIVNRLHNAGVIVLPVAKSSNYLSVKEQLVWLKLSNPSINDTAISHIASCKAITRLDLSNSRVTDKSLSHLRSLQQLQYLNLVGTRVTASGIMQLKELKNLKNIFLYKTGVGGADWSALQKAFPGTQLDSGKYAVPTFVTDTARLDESGLIK
jgi:mono/diheme cytochrome c family protein